MLKEKSNHEFDWNLLMGNIRFNLPYEKTSDLTMDLK